VQWPRSAGVGKGSNVPVPAARARLLVRRIALAHGLADIWLTEPDRRHGAGAQRQRKPRVSQNAGSTTGRATTGVALLRAWGRRLGLCLRAAAAEDLRESLRHLRINELLLTPWADATPTIPITSSQAK
jgi:hypothetical protein